MSNSLTTKEVSAEESTTLELWKLPRRKRRETMSKLIDKLPIAVQDRISDLKNLQLDCVKIDVNYHNDLHELRKKYQKLYQPLYDQRAAIVNGTLEAQNAEPTWKKDLDVTPSVKNEQDFSEVLMEIEKLPEDAKGIHKFWLTIFRNNMSLADMVNSWDKPVLEKMTDLRLRYEENSFSLDFCFDENDYFTNTVLTKTYFIKSDINEDDPFRYEGYTIKGCEGCDIDWKPGKNLTIRKILKEGSFIEVPKVTFFYFFKPPEFIDGEDDDEEVECCLLMDFKIGKFLRKWVIPKAVLYFTGEKNNGPKLT